MRREEIHATLIVMVGLGATTATGYLREAALAYELGVGRAADIFLIAFSVPEFVLTALPIILTAAFIPLFAAVRQQAGEKRAWHFGRQTSIWLLALLLGVVLLAAWGAPLYIRLLAPGFETWERGLSVQALYRMLPAIILMGGANLVTAALHVYRRFARPALAAAMNNLAFIAALIGLPLVWAVGRAAWGVTLGAALALFVQLPLLWRFRPRSQRAKVVEDTQGGLPPTISDLARLAGPLTVGYAVHHAILFVDRSMASTLGVGSVAALNYGYRLALVVGQLSGLAVSTALFPAMAEQAARRDDAGMRVSLAGALALVWAIGLPACAGLVLLRGPIVQVLFERGAFDQEATAAVSDVLRWYAPAVLADALCQPLWRAVYAWRKARTVLAVNGLQTLIRVVGNVALMSRLGYDGLALSAAVGLSVQLLILLWLVRRRLGKYLTAAWWQRALGITIATGCAVIMTGLVYGWLPPGPALVDLLISGTSGGLTYLFILWLIGRRKRAQ